MIIIISGCSDQNGDDPSKKTNPGYVAFDYTCYSFRKYTPLLKEIYQFNEYVKQSTLAGRDSVDRLYFRDVKIFYDEQKDVWTLQAIRAYGTDFPAISIQTNGKNLDETGAVWTVSEDPAENYYPPFEFYVENAENSCWHITEHDYKSYDTFEYTTEWDVRFQDGGKGCLLKGSGTLLSLRSPKLKLEYSITEPLEISENSVSLGTVRILATDVDRKRTEETSVRILSNETVEITYGNHTGNWDYSIF
jgi:hypothetical protein